MAKINGPTPGQHQTSPPRPTAQLVNEIKGKHSFVATSSEAFAARKQVEIDLEAKHDPGKPDRNRY
jgi:hypothetical protein